MNAFQSAMRCLLCASTVVLLGACNTASQNQTPQIAQPTSSTMSIEMLRDEGRVQAEAQLGVKFDVMDRQDNLKGQNLFVYHNSVTGGKSPLYLTVSVMGNGVGWSALRKNDATASFETYSMQAPEGVRAASLRSQTLLLSSSILKYQDMLVPEGLKQIIELAPLDPAKKDDLGAQSVCDPPANACEPPGTPHCKHCTEVVNVPGHYEELPFWQEVVVGYVSAVTGGSCGSGSVGCTAVIERVLHYLTTWVPGYSYCNRWSDYGVVCPVSQLPDKLDAFDPLQYLNLHVA